MSPQDLQELLRQLHQELGKADSVDAGSRELLALVARDIDALSGAGDEASAHVPALERLAVRFESDHPGLSAVARQVADALAKAGI
jgi:hypothetical protein